MERSASSIIAARPALNVKKSGPNKGLGIPYSPLLLWKAQKLLLEEADKMGASKPYRFDLVDLQRQILTNLGQVMHKRAAGAFRKKDRKGFLLHSNRFLELMHDTDVLLRTREEFNFDKWLTDAAVGELRKKKRICLRRTPLHWLLSGVVTVIPVFSTTLGVNGAG